MPKKLTNLKIVKVDFVDAGANPDADILLYKRRDGGGVEKSAETFSEELNRRSLDKIAEDMWNLSYALNDSLCSILGDDELDIAQKQAAMLTSLSEFTETAKEAVTSWSSGAAVGLVVKAEDGTALNPLAETLAKARCSAFKRFPAKAEKEPEHMEPKGEEPDMRIDRSKLTAEEVTALEAIEKKAGVPDEPPVSGDTSVSDQGGQESQPTEKRAPDAPVAASEPTSAPSDEEVFKSLPPKIREEFEALKKFRQDTEDEKLREIAGGYSLIGKTGEQLFPVLKKLKETDQGAYDTMLAALDDAKAAVEKSGVFSEIGRTGNGSASRDGGAVKEAEAKAAELMKVRKGLTRQQAVDAVLQADPELAKRYEEEE